MLLKVRFHSVSFGAIPDTQVQTVDNSKDRDELRVLQERLNSKIKVKLPPILKSAVYQD